MSLAVCSAFLTDSCRLLPLPHPWQLREAGRIAFLGDRLGNWLKEKREEKHTGMVVYSSSFIVANS